MKKTQFKVEEINGYSLSKELILPQQTFNKISFRPK